MHKVRKSSLLPLFAMLVLPACVSGPRIVTVQTGGCAALLPQEWRKPVSAPALDNGGETIGDWVSYADAVTGKLDVANDRTVSAIGIVERCEKRDALAIKKGSRGWLARLFS